jgi:hypothetical protein
MRMVDSFEGVWVGECWKVQRRAGIRQGRMTGCAAGCGSSGWRAGPGTVRPCRWRIWRSGRAGHRVPRGACPAGRRWSRTWSPASPRRPAPRAGRPGRCQVTSESIVARLPDSGRYKVVRSYRVSSTGSRGPKRRRRRAVNVSLTYVQALFGQRAPVAQVVGDPFLDGGLAGTFGLDLEEAHGAVQVGPGADLVAAAPAMGGQHVAVQVGVSK